MAKKKGKNRRKFGCDNRCEAKGGASNVLIFWPNLRLAVLIVLVLIKKKRVYVEGRNKFGIRTIRDG